MKLFKLAFIAAWACFALNFAKAQSPDGKVSRDGVITGVVTDTKDKPVDRATISLLNAKDSAVVSTTITDAKGKFSFTNVLRSANYLVKVTSIAYQTFYTGIIPAPGKEPTQLPAIKLTELPTALKEVIVSAPKEYIEQKIDRTVLNVNALISNTGANALEVLQKAPGVVVDPDGNISFKGKGGVMVMIDDKPTYLSAANLATYLRSLPSTALDKIELMDNPPAKYDAAGTSVINIKTKKNTIKGFNGNNNTSYGIGFYGRFRESLNLNYRVDKVNLFANIAYNKNRTYRRLTIDRDYFNLDGSADFSFSDVSIFRPRNEAYNLKAGMDFYLSPKTTWGVVLTGGLSNNNDDSPVYSSFYNLTGAVDSIINTENISKGKFNNGGININYSHKLDTTGKALTFDLDYIRNVAGSNQTFINNTFNNGGGLQASQTLTNDLPSYINIYAAKVDFIAPQKNDGKFEAGVKSSYVNTDNAANYFNLISGVSTINYDNTNRFLYKENINAAYLNYNFNVGRWGFQTGLRAENTNGNGHQLGNAQRPDSSFTNHYTNLFPTAYLSYKLDSAGNNNLVASYGRRVGRPNYGQLNPFTNIVDKFTHFEGNPFLRPQFTDIYKLAYSYKSLFTLTFNYSFIDDVQGETIHQKGNIFVSTSGNIGRRTNWYMSVNFNPKPANWWTINFFAEVYRARYTGKLYSGYIDQAGNTIAGNINNQFTFGKGWSGELSGFYNGSGVSGQFKTIPNGVLSAGLQKKILSDKGSVRLNINDIFRTLKPSGQINYITNTQVSYSNLLDTRAANLSFTYSFGKTINNPAKRAVGSADSEQSRAH